MWAIWGFCPLRNLLRDSANVVFLPRSASLAKMLTTLTRGIIGGSGHISSIACGWFFALDFFPFCGSALAVYTRARSVNSMSVLHAFMDALRYRGRDFAP